MPSQIVAKKTNFVVTNINFSQGNALLNEQAKKFLIQFATDLQQNSGSEEIKLYVLGLANNEQTEKEQWILSAKRAQAVADFLNDILPTERLRSIYSWGAGPGSLWVEGDSIVSRQTQILIAVLNENE
jgi:outer membrane protein OmpA-like peptidoglycan-associated protein